MLFFHYQSKSISGADMSQDRALPRTRTEPFADLRPGSAWSVYRWPLLRRDVKMVVYISPCDHFSRILCACILYPDRSAFNDLKAIRDA